MEQRVSVVLADDERLICTLLQKIIRWDDMRLELSGVAHNGRDLMALILDKRPDIVITDICMPEIDGIELIRQVRERGIPCRFIIVSGYRLFEYAHNALKYNVEDYILKPIDDEELNERLKELAAEVLAEKRGAPLVGASGNDGYRRFFLNRVVEDAALEGISLEAIDRAYGIRFVPGLFQVVLVALDVAEPEAELADDSGTLQKKLALSLERMLRKVCAQVLVDIDGYRILAGINYTADEASAVRAVLEAYFSYARDLVNLFVGMKVTLGVGSAAECAAGLKKSKAEAACAIWARIEMGLDQIIDYDRLASASAAFSQEARDALMAQVRKSCERWDAQSFSAAARALFTRLREHFCPQEAQRLCAELVECFFQVCGATVNAYSSEDYLRKQIHYGMKCATTMDAMQRAILDPIRSTMTGLINQVRAQEAKPVRQAEKYIEENYFRPLRLEDLAALVNLSPTYFSNLFKKETGETFCDFLTQLRLEKAKEYLRKSDLTVAQIADKVGYGDARYFSKLFGKAVGIKPSEYRKIYG